MSVPVCFGVIVALSEILFAISTSGVFIPATSSAATIIVNNQDGVDEGFNDPQDSDPASSVGGNTGVTLGEQRLQAFQNAAENWASRLESPIPIVINASMDPLTCTLTSATIGSAGPYGTARRSDGYRYPLALANAIAGVDLAPDLSDVTARFNSDLGLLSGPCASFSNWYYGLDGQNPAGTIDFAEVVYHELAHGLGFVSGYSLTTGEWLWKAPGALVGGPLIFDKFLTDRGCVAKDIVSMTDGERLAAAVCTDELVWTGAGVSSAAGILTAGRHASTSEVLMYAPSPVLSSSSVSHFDKSLWPDELMEPSHTPTVDSRLTEALLGDVGWSVTAQVIGNLENPGMDSYKSGIGIISGWVCSATAVVVTVDGIPIQTAYGTERTDTQGVCGDTYNGFGALYNWNRFGDGLHTAVAYADGVEFGRSNFTVTRLSGEFLTGVGAAGWIEFPTPGDKTYIKWQESSQNFVMYNPSVTADGGSNSTFGRLENPGAGASKSGIGIISGWICSAGSIVVTIDGMAIPTAYGTERTDTAGVCGDTDNGFAAIHNWNRFGDGAHTAIAYADGEEFARSNFTVTTLAAEFLTGLSGAFLVPEFPFGGKTTTVYWVESEQNFAIRKVE